jgi:hypothetical protein
LLYSFEEHKKSTFGQVLDLVNYIPDLFFLSKVKIIGFNYQKRGGLIIKEKGKFRMKIFFIKWIIELIIKNSFEGKRLWK